VGLAQRYATVDGVPSQHETTCTLATAPACLPDCSARRLLASPSGRPRSRHTEGIRSTGERQTLDGHSGHGNCRVFVRHDFGNQRRLFYRQPLNRRNADQAPARRSGGGETALDKVTDPIAYVICEVNGVVACAILAHDEHRKETRVVRLRINAEAIANRAFLGVSKCWLRLFIGNIDSLFWDVRDIQREEGEDLPVDRQMVRIDERTPNACVYWQGPEKVIDQDFRVGMQAFPERSCLYLNRFACPNARGGLFLRVFQFSISSLALCCPKVISSLPTWIVPEGWRIIKSVKVKPNPEFQAFTALVDRVLAVPHSEILRREAEYKRQAAPFPLASIVGGTRCGRLRRQSGIGNP